MPGGFPKGDIFNANGVAILSRDDRFNHLWISSRGLYFWDNETSEDISKCRISPPYPSAPRPPKGFGPNVMVDFPNLPI